MTLTKRGSRIEVMQDNGLICFCYGKSDREWIIRDDLEKFVQFSNRNGYEKRN